MAKCGNIECASFGKEEDNYCEVYSDIKHCMDAVPLKASQAPTSSLSSVGLSISCDKELLETALKYGYLIIVPVWIGNELDFVIKPVMGEDRDYLSDRGY